MSTSTLNHYFIIRQQWKKRTEKIPIPPDTKVSASEINKIVDGKYELHPAKEEGWVIACNWEDVDAINKKATKKLNKDVNYQVVHGDAVLIQMKDLYYVAGDKRQKMKDYIQEQEAQEYMQDWWS